MFFKFFFRINSIIKKIFFKLVYGRKFDFGRNLRFRSDFKIMIEKKGKLQIGNNIFFNNGCHINVLDEVIIEDECIFGECVKIYDHNHIFKYKNKLISEQGMKKEKVHIKRNCWIGSNVTILKGVTIGENCVIGAGVILTKDVEANTLVKLDENNIVKEKINFLE